MNACATIEIGGYSWAGPKGLERFAAVILRFWKEFDIPARTDKVFGHVPGIKKLHSSPDIYLVDDLLTMEECESIIGQASKKDMKVRPGAAGMQSPFSI